MGHAGPARDVVYVATHLGDLMGIDETGAVRWTIRLPGPTWQSPVVVDDVLSKATATGSSTPTT